MYLAFSEQDMFQHVSAIGVHITKLTPSESAELGAVEPLSNSTPISGVHITKSTSSESAELGAVEPLSNSTPIVISILSKGRILASRGLGAFSIRVKKARG
jgi:hypothetical protein